MVAGFQDDVDLEDKPPGRLLPPTGPAPRDTVTLPSDELAGHPKATVLAPQKCVEPETKQYVQGSSGRGPPGRAGWRGGRRAPDQLFVPKGLHKGLEATQGRGAQGRRAPRTACRGLLWRARACGG